MTRQFTHRTAVRERTPLFVGLVGPSGSGKTKSALRVADGMRRVFGGKVFVVDTENHRAEHYAHEHDFEHVDFQPPFDPDSYVDVVSYCVAQGASIVVIDNMSHEHEGDGGVLEMFGDEYERLGGKQANNFTAWIKPKAAHKRFLNSILRCPANIVGCFRSREKMEIRKGKEPVDLGYMPIAPDDLVYEMHVCMLLRPLSNGHPTWSTDMPGERRIAKLPSQFHDLLASSPQIDEGIGEQLARWAAGGAVKARRPAPRNVAEHLARYAACSDPEEFTALEEVRQKHWGELSAADKKATKAAADAAKDRLDKVSLEPPKEAAS